MKKQNVRIAKELIKIAKSLIADFEWNEYAIYECRKQFEKDLQDQNNMWNKSLAKRGEFPLDDETLKKCLRVFDTLFKELTKYSSPGTQYVCNIIDRYKQKYKDCPIYCDMILTNILNDHINELGLKK